MHLRLTLALVIAFALALPSAADAVTPRADSDAPPGAPADWLPSSQWVMERWVPFSEPRLYAALDSNVMEVDKWLNNDPTHSLNALAADHGVSPEGLAARIVGPQGSALLVRRTEVILDQPHLSQHMLFHTFHQDAIGHKIGPILGVPESSVHKLFNEEDLSWGEIAAKGGVSKASAYKALMALDRSEGDIGVQHGAMPANENAILRRRDSENFAKWWGYRQSTSMASM
jgi:hypothetical protein